MKLKKSIVQKIAKREMRDTWRLNLAKVPTEFGCGDERILHFLHLGKTYRCFYNNNMDPDEEIECVEIESMRRTHKKELNRHSFVRGD